MEKLEQNIIPVWREIKAKAVVTLNDIEKLNKEFELAFIKIQRQRQRLEDSRDMWKGKFMELQNEK